MNLAQFFTAHLARPYVAGEWDCVTFCAAWAIACGHPDPLGDLRGTYSETDDLVALAWPRLEAAGLVAQPLDTTGTPSEGDIGVIQILEQPVAAICAGKRWAFVATHGLGFTSVAPDDVLQVWRPAWEA